MAIRKVDEWIHEKLLRAYKVQVDPDYVFLVHGGSNINDYYHFGIRLLKNILQFNRQNVVIVGPQTYWFFETPFRRILTQAKQSIFLFCRERVSYQFLTSLNLPKNVRVLLCHDSALYLSKQDFRLRKGYHTLVCLRTDRASAILQKSKKVKEILESAATFGRIKGKVVFEDLSLNVDFRNFVSLIETARSVFTDRLHVAILAAILHGISDKPHQFSRLDHPPIYASPSFQYSPISSLDQAGWATGLLGRNSDMTGFRSTTGVPSMASNSSTCISRPFTETIRQIVLPSRFGRFLPL